VLAQAEAQFVYRIQTVGGFGGKSDQLNAYNVFLGEPEYFTHDLARYLTATPASLAAAAARFLAPPPPVSVSVVPQGQHALALPDSALVVVH
jgi:zinc protease